MLSAGDFARSLWAIWIQCQESSTGWVLDGLDGLDGLGVGGC